MLQHQTNSQNNLTFLKSNYKYKRRNIPTMRALPACEARRPNQLAETLSETKTSATPSAATAAAAAATETAAEATTTPKPTSAAPTGRKCSTILSLLIVIIWKVSQAVANCLRYVGRIIANANDHENAYANVVHDHDVNAVDVVRHSHPHSHPGTAYVEDDANDEVSSAREQQQQHPQQQHQRQLQHHHLSSSSPEKSEHCMTTKTKKQKTTTQLIMLPANKTRLSLMTLLIALLLSMRLTSAGTCWQTHLGSGKCNQIFATNFTKSDCCGVSQTFSYTDRELSSVEYFFATAIGGGVECVPCIETCKGFKCGPNKKCVKRKGRPKCVCAPECGATLRRRHQQQQKHQHHTAPETRSSSSKPPRGLRSLSSGILNTNLGLDGAKRQLKQSGSIGSNSNNCTDNQRHQQQNEKEMPKQSSHRRVMQGETKHRRLLIIDSGNLQEQPTTRRLQMERNGGRVQMDMGMEGLAPLKGSDRRRHWKNNSNNNNGNSKHLTRSMTTLKSDTTKVTPAATGANDSSTTPAQTGQSRQKFANANEPANDINRQSQQQQKDNAPARVRHQHQHQHQHQQQQQEHAPNHEQQFDNGSQQRRHKHNYKDKLHTASTDTENTTMSGSGARRRLYMSEHGSQTAASSGTSRSNNHRHMDNTDDLTFLTGIYETAPVTQLHSQQHQQQQQHSNPVCGNDGRTYNTECQLRKRACRTNNAQLEVAYSGHCKTSCNGVQCRNSLTCVEDQYMMPHCITCKIDCPWEEGRRYDMDSGGLSDEPFIDEERAVCGVDGKTYKSTCDINRMICKIGRSIAVAYPGACRADHKTCADIKCGPKDTCLVDLQTHLPRCVSCRYKCSRKQQRSQFRTEKICGYNNQTYNSWCEMRKDSCATGYFIGVRSTNVC